MSLFRRRSLKANMLSRPEIEVVPETQHIIKKKRTFFLHNRSESSASQMTSLDATTTLPTTLPPSTPFTPLKENSFLSSLQRSSSTRKLQKRPLSGSSVSTASPAPSPNYILDKPPRISSKDYTHAYQNLYILGDGQDDEMYTLFEMINGTRPIVYDTTLSPELSSTSAATTPNMSSESQRREQKPASSGGKNHSRASSSSSSSAMSNTTYQTDFSDFQFDFAPEHIEKPVLPRPNAQELFQRKLAANMSIINEQPSVESDYEDFVDDLTSDDDSDSDYGDEDDFIIEEGQAIQVSLQRICTPTIITIRSSCEL
ncbi:hypothetical protein ABW19_dt0204088 [Dactylella cylindrospora]|nr:hypothetical protein ABW19_dt0204088 [Dactylella cylindrospora]